MRIVKSLDIVMVLLFAASCLWAAQAKQTNDREAEWWGPAPAGKLDVAGSVTSVSATAIALQTRQGVRDFTVDATTRVFVRGEKAAIGDVKVGDRAIVRFASTSDKVAHAAGIAVPKPNFGGEITAIQDKVVTIRERVVPAAATGAPGKRGMTAPRHYTLGPEHQITVTDATKYQSHGYVGSLADLRVGYLIVAEGTVTGQNMTADAIQFAPDIAKGTVTAVNGKTITVQTIRQIDLSLEASDATAVFIKPRVGANRKGTLADVKAGSPANVGFHAVQSGSAPLLWIDLLTGT